ncbi:unnamed protein product [Parnassius apollo]|uniref:(apollo) hypothetical protein n=1 Tax=Parnassius apollo TaxID=110799 RepID=A0A8S3XPT9_PARAO|nr:unnamed protein product [Parnassius apollo]
MVAQADCDDKTSPTEINYSNSCNEHSTLRNEPSTSCNEPSTSYIEPSTSYNEPSTAYNEPTTSFKNIEISLPIGESNKRCVRTRGGHVGKSSRTGKILKQNSETETDVAGQGKRRRVRTRGGSASSITHQLRTGRDLCQIYSVQVPIEEELSAILNDNDERDNCARAQFQAQELSDKQLLDILEASDDNFDDEVLDENFLNNFDDSDSDDDNMIPTETFAPPTSDGECLNWSDQISHIKDIAFIGNPMGLNVQLEATEPINFFNLIMTDYVIQDIIDKTNRNASNILAKSLPGSRIHYWKNVTVSEFKIFLGLLFHMGTIKLNRIQDYWKKHRLFNLTCFSEHMSRNRFLLILRAMHFENIESDDNRLAKISPLVMFFNNRMTEIYNPVQNLCIDESLVLWRGRLIFRQYIKNKSQKYGIKLYILTDANGIILKQIVYAGAGDPIVGGVNHSSKVVLQLLHDFLNKGYSVFMDNFYNSVDLTEKLLSENTYCTGTLRLNRKNNPKYITTKKLKKGECVSQFNQNGVCVMKWRDNRDVTMISSQFNSQMITTTTRRNTEVSKPKMVVEYNRNMGGIDHQDQMIAYYCCEHKSIRWYIKLGIHLLQQMMYNSFTLSNLFSGKKLSYYEFRQSVIENLLPEAKVQKTGEVSEEGVILNIVHIIQPCPRKGKSMRRRCKYCWEVNKIRKDTPFYCPNCPQQPGFCIVDCFRLYHKYT